MNGTILLRRNIIVDATEGMGLYNEANNNLVLEENLFDHNGWNETIPGTGPNVFNHNVYLNENGPNMPATIRGNIFARDSSGNQFRSGGAISNNLFVQNPYGHNIGLPFSGMVTTVTNNVHLEQIDNIANGTTVYAYASLNSFSSYLGNAFNLGKSVISNNILAHRGPTSGSSGGGIFND